MVHVLKLSLQSAALPGGQMERKGAEGEHEEARASALEVRANPFKGRKIPPPPPPNFPEFEGSGLVRSKLALWQKIITYENSLK